VADPHPRYGAFQLPSTGEEIGPYAAAFHNWLRALLAKHRDTLSHVVFESPILPTKTSMATVRKLTGLAWHCEWLCFLHEVDCAEAHLQQVKKFFAGHGRAEKADMIAAARQYGFPLENHQNDEADALGVRFYAISQKWPQHLPESMRIGLIGGAAVA